MTNPRFQTPAPLCLPADLPTDPAVFQSKLFQALARHYTTLIEEFDQGPGNFCAAVVEWPDGQVEVVRAERIRFLTRKAPDSLSHDLMELTKWAVLVLGAIWLTKQIFF